MKICAFDFDGTLIKNDSIKLFCRWVSNNQLEFLIVYHLYFRFILLFKDYNLKFTRVAFFHKLYKKRKLDIQEFTKILLKDQFEDSENIINEMKKEYKVIIVSASFDFILSDYSDYYGINLFANSLNNKQDLNFSNKVYTIKSNFKKEDILEVAYGNSEGDFDMLESSKQAYFRYKNGKILKWQK
ncbi:HAD-IB family phosphatase [Polaribacter haliotis]|uniref:HAD-IB family phosphatase n=1 Tax=Polaribacter haliotis TaxID=1888915 RepID=A0A7L8AJC8_9FLAO|nr:HAD-IB family phosphatase [Polaribacter haliotis]QOD62074.1 HAD-IB family phosphatase [Polaribacter haliotis]